MGKFKHWFRYKDIARIVDVVKTPDIPLPSDAMEVVAVLLHVEVDMLDIVCKVSDWVHIDIARRFLTDYALMMLAGFMELAAHGLIYTSEIVDTFLEKFGIVRPK